MAKFSKAFTGCKAGEIYPIEFQPGDECPKELEPAARAVGAIPAAKAHKKAPEAK
jgi:hypothetical protein